MQRRGFLLKGALTLAALPLASAATAQGAGSGVPQIAGNYNAFGRNANGSAYEGRAEIRQNGAQVEIYWTVGNQSYNGRGVIEGRVVTIDWGAASPIVYVVMGNQLHGTWDNGTALERLTRR